jgi:hypothetical protein
MKGSPTPPDKVGQVLALIASGMKYGDIAKTTGVTLHAIKKLAQVDENKALIVALRSAFKVQGAASAAKIQPLLDDAIVKALENFDPAKIAARDIDGLLRASLNLEKRAASIAGENRTIFQPSATQVQISFAPWMGTDTVTDEYGKVIDAEPAQLAAPAPPPVDEDSDVLADEDDDGA